jgi:hypothetical protein
MPDDPGKPAAEPSLIDRVCNRHFARLYCNLEDANCPTVFIGAVRNEQNWLRDDLNKLWKEMGMPNPVDGNGP